MSTADSGGGGANHYDAYDLILLFGLVVCRCRVTITVFDSCVMATTLLRSFVVRRVVAAYRHPTSTRRRKAVAAALGQYAMHKLDFIIHLSISFNAIQLLSLSLSL
jgi:hypothetical protein